MLSLRHKPLLRNGAIAAIALFVPLAVLLFMLGRGKELDLRHEPLDFTERFDFATGTLAEYSDYAQRRLLAARPDLDEDERAGLAPFRLEPPDDCPRTASGGYRSGIVLTHDVQESPYTMLALGKYLQSSCFLVYGLLLPGHGTRPGDLLQVGWQDWFAAERFAARELGREVDSLYLAGHGVGGTLALLESATNAGVGGLILIAPRLDVQAPPWAAVAATALGWLYAPVRWEQTAPATTPYRDASRPWRLFTEINGLVASTLAALPAASEIPVFTVLSLEDASIDTGAVLAYMQERTHPLSHTLLFAAREFSATPRLTVRPTAFPEYGRLGASHLGLMIPGSDRTFGREGSSRECGHYAGSDPAAYGQCMAGESDFRGEITPEDLAQGTIQRITYNPYFGELANQLNVFIAPVARVVDRRPR